MKRDVLHTLFRPDSRRSLALVRPTREAFPDPVLDAEYEPLRRQLSRAGLSEERLRKMDPDDRVAALENARLDPYDYIFLACS